MYLFPFFLFMKGEFILSVECILTTTNASLSAALNSLELITIEEIDNICDAEIVGANEVEF